MSVITLRVCRRCGTAAAEACLQNEPICPGDEHGLVIGHSFVDVMWDGEPPYSRETQAELERERQLDDNPLEDEDWA